MREFESFVYLDPQKTASTFICKLLDKHCREPALRVRKHKGLEADCDRSKFHFISVRDPLDSYLSLYFYGVQERGNTRAMLERSGMEDFYDGTARGFANWLTAVLRPANAKPLRESYSDTGNIAALVGFQSYRHLRLALPGADDLLESCRTEDDIRAAYARHGLPAFAVRYESLTGDLETLLQGPLRHAMKDLDAALDFVRRSRPINASQRTDKSARNFPISDRLHRRLRRREWFLYETFGYR